MRRILLSDLIASVAANQNFKTLPSGLLMLPKGTRASGKLLLLLSMSFLAASGADRSATPSTFASVWSSALGGDTILLSPGSYGAFSGGSKSSVVTITPDPGTGGTRSNVVFGALNLGSSQNITFQNLTVGGATVGTSSAPALHIHLVGITFTAPVCILTPANVNQDTLIDSSSFINIGQSCTEGRLGVRGYNNTVTNGVVISNNLFSQPGPSDGVQIIGGAYGTVIGPGNEFVGIKQSGCGAVHCDPIQFYGASRTTIIGNYVHGNSTGIMSSGSGSDVIIVTNNVFVTDGEYPDQIVQEGGSNDVFDHNTFANGARIRLCNCNGTGLNSNETVTNNILTGGLSLTEGQSTSGFTMGNNLSPGGGLGTNSVTGVPTYVGGSQPTSMAGYALTSTSLGHLAASNGADIGVSTGPVVPDTTPPSVPTGLSAAAVSSSQINLTWTASSDNIGIAGYKIFRGGTQIATAVSTSYSDTGRSASTAYTYTVSAYDAAGNNSAQSASKGATTQAADTSAPTVPASLAATAVSSSQINLTWSASSDNVGVAGYKIYRGGTQIGTSATTSYSASALVAATSYAFTVSAYDADGNNSAQSASASATTFAAATCLTSSSSTWQSTPIAAQATSFTVAYDDIPGGNNMNGVTGLSLNAATAYTSLAVITRFNPSGFIDAMNGASSYTAVSSIPYTAGGLYHFRVVIDPQAHTYSAYVTPPSASSEIQVAANYAFRTDQATTSSLNSWSLYSEPGSTHNVCNFALGLPTNAPAAPTALTVTSR